MRKIISITLSMIIGAMLLTGCANGDSKDKSEAGLFDTAKGISVVSREDGSGTRGAFVELTGVEQKNADGQKEDKTTVEAIIASKTDIMLTNVQGNEYAIGYISMGSLNDTIKAVQIDQVDATAENVKNGSYTLSRPFNIATGKNVSEVAQDFIDFIMSKQGQEVVAKSYITVDDAAKEYTSSEKSGKIMVAGSSSVSPLMEKLKEAYILINPQVTIEINTSDSTAGMTTVKEGICDIGMASRQLKESELADLEATAIALDGIAVIVNNKNTVQSLSIEQVMKIYTGDVTKWNEI